MKFDLILIVGSTHGNEWTGEAIIHRYAEELKNKYPNLPLEFMIGNPQARSFNQRYVDEDLNRVFKDIHLDKINYERSLAKIFLEKIHNKNVFIIDIHSTTSNLGDTLIITQEHGVNFEIAKRATQKLKSKVIYSPDLEKKYLVSQSVYGMMIEIGPVKQNEYDERAIASAFKHVDEILNLTSQVDKNVKGEIKLYAERKDILFPNGEVINFSENFNQTDFKKYTDKCFPYEDESIEISYKGEFFPIFIGEVSYQKSGLAFTICEEIEIQY